MEIKKTAILNGVTLGIHVSISYLTKFKLINPKDIGQVSNEYPSLFTPAGITFAIWGLIYFSLLSFFVYHLVIAYKKDANHPANRDLRRLGYLFIINNLATATWVLAWTHELFLLSVVLILIQLVTLIMMNQRLSIHDASRSLASKIFTQLPLSIYFGWISIATIANISTWLTAIQWDGWGISDINWAITMIAIAVMITVWVINRKKNVFFGLVVLWAFYGIILKREEIDSSRFEPIIMVTYGGMGIVAAAILFGLIRNLREKRVLRLS